MKFTLAVMGLAGLVAAAPQAVTSAMAPSGTAPAGCQPTYSGSFEITIVKPSGMKKRQTSTCGQTGILTLTLNNGMLTDNLGRTGYIAGANQQFQFDKPVQAGGLYTSGFSVCGNGSIALGPTTTFYQCQSGSFYNLYYENVADQCSPVNIDIIPCSGSSSASGSSSGSATAAPASTASGSAAAVSVSSDGQPQATVAATQVPVSLATDGQPQATVAATQKPAPVSEYTDGQPQATAAATSKSNATVAATASPTIVAAGAANLGFSASLMAGVVGLAAYLL